MTSGESVFGWLKVIVILLVTLVAGFLFWQMWGLLKKAGSAASDAAEVVSDYVTGGENDHNFISRGADAVLGVTQGMTLGTAIYDIKEKIFGDPLENQKRDELEQNRPPESPFNYGA